MATATPRTKGAGGARDWVRQTETAPYHEPVLCPPGDRATGGGPGLPPPPFTLGQDHSRGRRPLRLPNPGRSPLLSSRLRELGFSDLPGWQEMQET